MQPLRSISSLSAKIWYTCGTDNDYGHPAEQTLTNLTLAGVRDIRMTAESGTVALPLIAYKENAV